ncbi:hypothetical protein THAOC_03078, partial [Thalassiosira oceanica]
MSSPTTLIPSRSLTAKPVAEGPSPSPTARPTTGSPSALPSSPPTTRPSTDKPSVSPSAYVNSTKDDVLDNEIDEENTTTTVDDFASASSRIGVTMLWTVVSCVGLFAALEEIYVIAG